VGLAGRKLGAARFASFEFDAESGRLTHRGIPRRLENLASITLSHLIENCDRIVPRSELTGLLWPGQKHGDFDHRLDKVLAKLRFALNDKATDPQFIETIRGRGYRFLAPVTFDPPSPARDEFDAAPVTVLSNSDPAFGPESAFVSAQLPPLAARRGLSYLLSTPLKLGAFAAVLVAAGAAAWWLAGRPGVHAHTRPVVLILGLHDASKTAGNEWLMHSVAEWLASDLDAGGELRMVQAGDNPTLQPQPTVNGCADLPPSLLETARQAFNADQIVYGGYSVTEDGAVGEQARLDLCLKDLHGGKSTESFTLIGAKGDIAQLVFNAGSLLRTKLGLKQLSSQSLDYLRATLPASLTAARLYAEGTSALAHFEPEEASVLLTQAAQIEPQHAPTHAALANAWSDLGYEQRSRDEAVLARDMAKGLSPIQQLDYEGLADEKSNDWPAAVSAYIRLVELHPDSVDYSLKLANAQTHASKAQVALETLSKLRVKNAAAVIDPRVDLAEAAADSAVSDFRGQLAASTTAELHAKAQGSVLLVADARMQQGDADDMLDHWDDALRLWKQAGQAYASIGDRGGMADALNHQAQMAWNKYDLVTANDLFEQAISLSKAVGDQSGIAFALSRQGNLRLHAGKAFSKNQPGAVGLFHQAAAIYHAAGNVSEEGNVLSQLGDEAISRTKYDEAKTFYLNAMTLSQLANDKSRIANRLLDLGIVAESQGQTQDAERYFRQSVSAYEEIGQKDRAAIAQERLGKALMREGRLDEAESMLVSVLGKMEAMGRVLQAINARSNLIDLELVHNPAKAEAWAIQNIDDSKRVRPEGFLGDPYSLAGLAKAQAQEGKLRDARQSIRLAFRSLQDSLHPDFLLLLLLRRGYVDLASRDFAAATSDFQRALALAQAQGRVYEELDARLGLTEMHSCMHRENTKSEFEQIRNDAERLGYGIFPIEIDTFVKSNPPSQPRELADARRN
jgi:DNA-binding winged helix-turn-helix (wHTH) protein/tetratricopeptide (TPR) repeat protein